HSLGYRAAMIRLRAEAASTSLPPLQLPSASHREDRPEVTLPPQKRLGESSSAATARPAGVETLQGAPVSTDTELGGYMREFETRVRQDTDEIYIRRAHAYIRHLMETEARMSREAWVRSTDASDLVHGEVMSLRTTVLGQMTEIRELHAADRMSQTVISELLRADHRRSTEITELRTALQGQGLAGGPTQPELPEEAGTGDSPTGTDQETINATTVTNSQLQMMIDQGVTAAFAARDALRSTNGDDSHNSETSVRRTERAAPRDALRSTNGDDSHNFRTGVRRTERATREYTYTDFLNNYAVENQVKFATCTLHTVALTWWNTHVKTVGHEAAYVMPWKMLMKMMTEKYYP
nr:reverse transcriptase domain-containing protein [Tanacetum cinerariifolium]